jgi:hypothetical protein
MPAAFALVRPPLSSRCWSVVAADSICMASKRSEDGDPWNPTATLINRLRMQCADTAGTVPCIQSEAQHNYRPARRDTAHQFSVPGLLVPRHLLSRRLNGRGLQSSLQFSLLPPDLRGTIQSEAQHNYRPARRDTAHQFSVPPASPGLLVPRHLLSRRLAQRSIFFPLPLIILAKG